MHSDVLTIGDLFEEDNFSWVNDEEAMAFSKIEELIYQFKIDYGKRPTTIYVSDSEESESESKNDSFYEELPEQENINCAQQ